MSSDQYGIFVDTAHMLANAAGSVLLNYYRKPYVIEHKEDKSPVTKADEEAESAMRAIIIEKYPDHGIIGEEFGDHHADAEFVWVLDPIDGTRSFISGIPLFTTLIALCHHGKPVLGLVAQPIVRERYLGVAGDNSMLNGETISCRGLKDVGDATISTTSPHFLERQGLKAFIAIQKHVKTTLYGGDAYQYMQVASGMIDLVIEEGLKPFDAMALVPVIEGAGGQVTDWEGKPVTLKSDGRIIASGDKKIHDAALHQIREAKDE